jgi:fructose-1,6-bisphosphatase/inositol monophosphatase family enzyme
MNELELKEYLDFAVEVAKESGKIMIDLKNLKKPFPSGQEYLNQHVASVIEDNTLLKINEQFPSHGLFGKKVTDNKLEWICDYIDGAYSYSRGFDISVTSVALTLNGKTVVSAVFNPWNNTLYSAAKGMGFFINGSKQSLSINAEPTNLKDSIIDVEWWPNAGYDIDTALHHFSLQEGPYILHLSSIIYAACLVCSGVFVAAALGKKMIGKNHEIAAISLITEESGCILTDLFGIDTISSGQTDDQVIEGLLFSKPDIHKKLTNFFKDNLPNNTTKV